MNSKPTQNDPPSPSDGAADPPVPLAPSAAFRQFASARHRLLDVAAAPERPTRYGYLVGDLGLLVARRALCEFVPGVAPTRIAGTPAWFRGVINLRGGLVPVFDLRVLLDMPTARTSTAPSALILDRGEHAAAIMVDEFPRPLRALRTIDSLPPMLPALRPFVSASWAQDDAVWLELEHRPFFASLAARMVA